MSRAAQKSPAVRRGAKERRPAPRVGRVLTVSWALSPEAAAKCGLAATLGAGSPVLEVRVVWGGRVREVEAAIVDGGTRRTVEAAGAGEWLRDGGLWHLDVPGVVSLTLREERGEVRSLYARCELAARLGLEGGRYELAGASILPG